MTTDAATSPPIRSPRIAYALAVLSGVLYFLGVPGVDVWLVAFVAHAPLLLAIHGRPARSAAVLGLVAGTVGSLLGFYWLYGMLRLFSGLPMPACAAIMALMCAFQGARMSLAAWLTSRAAARGWPWAIAFVLATATTELLYPLLFPWYNAFQVHQVPLLLQAADLGGVYLVGALLLGPNVALAEITRAWIEKARADRLFVALGLAAPLAGAAYGAARIRSVDAMAAAAPAINVGIAQGNLPLLSRSNGVEVHRRLTEQLRDRGAHLVVWSEGSVPDVWDEAVYKEAARRRVTEGLTVPVLFGAGVKKTGPDGRARERNTALLADIDGKIIGRYDKQFLLPFGEYIPFGETFPELYEWSPNSGHMVPGHTSDPMVIAGHPITALICYEDILPFYVNRVVSEARPELLVNLTIDTWFGDTIEPWEHLALAQMRAVEHRRYLVRSTNSGVSAIVDPVGRVTVHGGLFDEEALLGEVRLMAPSTVYEAIGDAPWYLAALAIAAMAAFRRREAGEAAG